MSPSTDRRVEAAPGLSLQPVDRAACDYCGGATVTDITERVAVGLGLTFGRVVAACSLCTELRVQGLGYDGT